MKIFTIGFTKKNAETFFSFLKKEKILRLLDVRLNNISQLSGFAKRDDLRFFLRELCGAEYLHVPDLVPTKVMLNSYKKGDISWEKYEDQFLNLMAQRKIEKSIHSDILENSCLLCSEHEPHFCHRRLVVEYLNETTSLKFKVKHLF